MPKHAYSSKKHYHTLFEPLPVQNDNILYFDKDAISLPYCEDFPKLHYHDRYEFGICESGDGLFLSDGVYSSVTEGDLIFIAPESRHYSRSLDRDKRCRCRFVYVNASEIEALLSADARELSKKIPPIIRPSEYPQAASVISEIAESCKRNIPNKERLAVLRGAVLLLEAERWFGGVYKHIEKSDLLIGDTDEAVAKTAEYLSLNYSATHSVKELAARCYLSESQLRRRFSAVYGMPPMAYRNYLRCNIAAELLARTRLSVSEISERIGYTSPSDFYRIFQKFRGSSPSEYRKQNINKKDTSHG